MSIVNLSKKVLVLINNLIKKYQQSDISENDITEIVKRLQKLLLLLSSAEGNVNEYLYRLTKKEEECGDSSVCCFRQNGEVIAICSSLVEKPTFKTLDKLENYCNCQQTYFRSYEIINEVNHIANEKDLFDLDRKLEKVVLEVFVCTYRTHTPQICWITLLTPEGTLFVIDAIQFRELIPRLRLLNCGVEKLIHCRFCLKNLIDTFGDIGCYCNYPAEDFDLNRKTSIDYRIRPIHRIFLEIFYKSMFNFINELKQTDRLEKLQYKNDGLEISPVELFCVKNNISYENHNLIKILELRKYLAKEFDEGEQYIIPDDQVLTLLEEKPTSMSEIQRIMNRMSPVFRLYVNDFLLSVREKSSRDGFSLKYLKSKDGLVVNDNSCSLEFKSEEFTIDDEESTLEISSD